MTVRRIAFARVQRVQNAEETLNEFKRTRLVSRKVGGRTEWEERPVGGQRTDYAQSCVCEVPEGSEG